MKRQQTEFPYRAKVGSTVVTITGRHYTDLLETNGFGLIPASSAVPVEGQEMHRNRSESTAIESERAKPWKRQGRFKQRPMTPRERRLKAETASLWISATLNEGPVPAVEVLQLAAKAGVNEWSLRWAKRRLNLRSIKVGGRRKGFGAVWFWTANGT